MPIHRAKVSVSPNRSNRERRHAMAAKGDAPEQRTVEYFDGIAQGYSSLYHERTPGGTAFRLRKQRVLELFDKPGGKVLDVGCGSGVMVDDLLAQDCAFWGVDPSWQMINQCRKDFGSRRNAHFFVGGAEEIGFPDSYFDAVICMGVLERVGNNRAALRELLRVLKRDGTLIVTLPNILSPYLLWRNFIFYPVVSLLRPFYYRLFGKSDRAVIPGHTLYLAKAYTDLLVRNGCRVTNTVYCGFNFALPPLDSLLPGLAATAMEKFEVLHHSIFRLLGACFIVRARKQ